MTTDCQLDYEFSTYSVNHIVLNVKKKTILCTQNALNCIFLVHTELVIQ